MTEFRWEPDLHERIREVEAGLVEPIADAVLSDARRLVPVDTGDLQRSLHRELAPGGLSARIGSDIGYAAYVEHGTENMDAQPYLRPALYRHRSL